MSAHCTARLLSQTLNYVRTPHRFELTLSEPLIIGKRRAAQRIMAKAIESISKGGAEGEVDVKAVLGQAREALIQARTRSCAALHPWKEGGSPGTWLKILSSETMKSGTSCCRMEWGPWMGVSKAKTAWIAGAGPVSREST